MTIQNSNDGGKLNLTLDLENLRIQPCAQKHVDGFHCNQTGDHYNLGLLLLAYFVCTELQFLEISNLHV